MVNLLREMICHSFFCISGDMLKRTLLITGVWLLFSNWYIKCSKITYCKVVSVVFKEHGYYKYTNKYFVTINGIILYWGLQIVRETFQEP